MALKKRKVNIEVITETKKKLTDFKDFHSFTVIYSVVSGNRRACYHVAIIDPLWRTRIRNYEFIN